MYSKSHPKVRQTLTTYPFGIYLATNKRYGMPFQVLPPPPPPPPKIDIWYIKFSCQKGAIGFVFVVVSLQKSLLLRHSNHLRNCDNRPSSLEMK